MPRAEQAEKPPTRNVSVLKSLLKAEKNSCVRLKLGSKSCVAVLCSFPKARVTTSLQRRAAHR